MKKLYNAILISLLSNEEARITFPNLGMDLDRLIELECYRSLEQISMILSAYDMEEHLALEQIRHIIYKFHKIPPQEHS